jgi:hypothetical protein
MPLDPNDELILTIWNFRKDFRKQKSEFLELARRAYDLTAGLIGDKPSQDDCEKLYELTLAKSEIFRGILARKVLLMPSLYKSMRLAFARYVLHNYWDEISL